MEHDLKTCLNVEEDGGLICTIYRPTEKSWEHQSLYSVRMMKLLGNEFNLSRGRFRSFRFEAQKHHILLTNDNMPVEWRPVTWVAGWSAAIVEWISENIDTAWSMKGVPIEVSPNCGINLEFSFADAIAAVHFTLRWR
jgi:hypothetical protein